MNPILNKIISLTMQKILVFGLALGGAYYFFYTYDTYVMLTTKREGVEREIETEREIQKDTDSTLKKELEVKDSVAALSLQFEKISKSLPTDITQSDVMAFIDDFSRKAAVKVTDKKPSTTGFLEVVEILPISVTLRGSYFDIGRFIQSVSVNQPITRVSDYTIKRDGTSSGQYIFSGKIIGYRSLEQKIEKNDGAKK